MYQTLCVILAVSFLAASGEGKKPDEQLSPWKVSNRLSYRNYGSDAVVKREEYVPYDVFDKEMDKVNNEIEVLTATINKAVESGTEAVNALNTRVSSLETDNCADNPCQNGGTCHSMIGDHFCQCPGNKAGTSCEIDVGSQVALPLLEVTNGEKWGVWYPLETCPSGSFAGAFRVKLEDSGHRDESACNAVELMCRDLKTGEDVGHVSSAVGSYGSWKGWQICDDGFFLVQFKLKVEPDHRGDQSAMNGIHMTCRGPGLDGSQTAAVEGPSSPWGSWGDNSKACPSGTAICGISSKIEPPYLAHDQSGMNDVIFQCCYI